MGQNLYERLTKEQIKESRRNNRYARILFREHGYMPDPSKTYDLHHKDEHLRHDDLERYIKWNIEDLECIEHAEHSILHDHFENLTAEKRSEIMKNLRADPESIFNSAEYHEHVSEGVKRQYADPASVYHTEAYRNKMAEGVKKSWNDARKKKQSEFFKALHADPSSIYHTADYQQRKAEGHCKAVIVEFGSEKLEFKSVNQCGEILNIKPGMIGWMLSKKRIYNNKGVAL